MAEKKEGISRRRFVKTGTMAAATIAASATAAIDDAEAETVNETKQDEPLKDYPVTHAALKPMIHPRLGAEFNARSAVRYLRFLAPATVERLELGRIRYGRAIPGVPIHPAHLTVSKLNEETFRWELVRDIEFPEDPAIRGEGLSQDMTIEEMQSHFSKLRELPPYAMDTGEVTAKTLRVECDREHPYWPNHGECNGGPFNVPFGALNELKAYGKLVEASPELQYNPILEIEAFNPKAPQGMRVLDLPNMLLYEGEKLSVGFSLQRPMLIHFGWDALGEGMASRDRLLATRTSRAKIDTLGGLSGPLLRTPTLDFGAQRWTGGVAVDGNRVTYRNLQAIAGVVVDAVFTVERDRLIIELTQSCSREIPMLEAETWRLAWDLTAGITGAAAEPRLLPGRNGDVNLPAVWASDGVGCLSCRVLDGADADTRLQVESYRFQSCVTGGFVLAGRPEPDSCLVLPAGKRQATFELAVMNLEPLRTPDSAQPSRGVRRHWPTVFSCFRPEYRGFSNNSASVNCHLSQGPPLEIAAHTERPANGPDPLELGRFTIGQALLDGGGYGYFRNLYLDSDPVVVSAAGRLHQAEPDMAWLRRIESGLVEAVDRMSGMMGEEGLVICRDLSGNSGSYRWSTNAMDVVGFGHIDGYVNAWSYRAFRNAAALFAALGRPDRATRCREWAEQIRDAYARQLLNPETGWVAGWRSRDGELHDYAFTWVNGVALAFGLLNPDDAENALRALERLRDEVGPPSARMGIPCNILPIREDDQTLPKILGLAEPTFEKYTDGSLSGWPATYYLRALSIYGLADRARKLAEELDEGYAAGIFNGGMGAGHEFRSWEGMPTGYEGTLIGCFGPIYAIAIQQGVLTPRDPEWWPSDA